MISLLFEKTLLLIAYLFLVQFIYRYGFYFDKKLHQYSLSSLFQLKKTVLLEEEITWIQYITSCTKSGLSLLDTLLRFQAEYPHFSCTQQIQKIIQGNNKQRIDQPIATILCASLERGTPLLEPLSILKKSKLSEIKMQRKIQAATLQIRMQAFIASILPIFILISFVLLDIKQLYISLALPISWIILASALLLNLIGLFWMKKIIQSNFIKKNTLSYEIQKYLRDFLQQWLSMVQVGEAVDCAFSQATLRISSSTQLQKELQRMQGETYNPTKNCSNKNHAMTLQQIFSLKQRAFTYGAPIKQEIIEVIEDIEHAQEIHWEETAQKLPIQLLLPIFLCIFPTNFLVILLPIIPILLNF